MKATVIRTGAHQGVTFSEVRTVNDDGLLGPIHYSVPGEFPAGTLLEITVEDLGVPDEELPHKTKAELKAEEKQEAADAKAEKAAERKESKK